MAFFVQEILFMLMLIFYFGLTASCVLLPREMALLYENNRSIVSMFIPSRGHEAIQLATAFICDPVIGESLLSG